MKAYTLIFILALCFTSITAFVVTPRNIQTDKRFQLKSSFGSEEVDSSIRIGIDKAWRYVPKPLLRIGGKGVADSHGNSLKELLNAHTVVKVKINSDKLGSLEDVFETLKALVVTKGKMSDVELIHVRKSENTILIGKEGTMENIRKGDFPPPIVSEES